MRPASWLEGWLRGADTGRSSRTIAQVLGGVALGEDEAPHDPMDVGRCVRLLDLAAENGQDWRGRMNELMRLRVTWAPLIPHWPAIEEAYRAQAAEEARQYADHVRVHRGQRLRFRPATGPSRCYYLVQWLRFRHDPYAGQDVPWQRLEVGDV